MSTFHFFGQPIAHARELFEVAALIFALGTGTVIWGYRDYRRLKTWRRLVKADSAKILPVGLLLVLFSIVWFVGDLDALHHGLP